MSTRTKPDIEEKNWIFLCSPPHILGGLRSQYELACSLVCYGSFSCEGGLKNQLNSYSQEKNDIPPITGIFFKSELYGPKPTSGTWLCRPLLGWSPTGVTDLG